MEENKKAYKKSKLTDEMIEKIVKVIQTGASYQSVCSFCGISERVFYLWLEKGREDLEKDKKSKQREFYEKMTKSLAVAEMSLIKDIKADEDWRAKAFILERRWQKTWGHKSEVKVEELNKKPTIVYNIKDMSTDELKKIMDEEEAENNDDL